MANNLNPFDELSNRLERIEQLLKQLNFGKQLSAPEETILTIEEAAAFTKTPKKTIYQYTSRRVIPYIKSGRRLLFRKSDLVKWLESRTKHP